MADDIDMIAKVKELYSNYPYPTPSVGEMLITDLSNAIQEIAGPEYYLGKRVLDAGCGTGHRTVALAKTLPETSFVGVDFNERSLETAVRLASYHQIANVRFEKHDLTSPIEGKFDIVVSTGVANCIRDYRAIIKHLFQCMGGDGFLLLWLYHTYGEYSRLLDRQFVHAVLQALQIPTTDQLSILRQLKISLPSDQYGTMPMRQRIESNQVSIDADAYLHPIVNTFTFDSISRILKGVGADWSAISGINWRGHSKLLDLSNTSKDPYFMVQASDIFSDSEIQSSFERFEIVDKLAILELGLKPTGFTALAGRGKSYALLSSRIAGNLID